MAGKNPTRVDLIEKLECLIEEHNVASGNVAQTFERLKEFIKTLDEEAGRAAGEELTDEELAIYDLLTRPEPKLTKAQTIQVKRVARDLLAKLQEEVSGFQWH